MEQKPPEFTPAQPEATEAPETPMFASTATGSTETPAEPRITFLERIPRGFWD